MRDRVWLPDADKGSHALHSGPFLPTTSRVPTCDTSKFKCAAHLYAKSSTRTPNNQAACPSPKAWILKENCLMPGNCISTDHYFSPVQGRLPHSFGKEKERHGYSCGSLFVDHASGKIFNFLQYSNTAHKTLQTIKQLEAMAREEGFKIKSYHSDNGIFATANFKAHCERSQQTFSFSGVGAKHQNGIAERNIKIVAHWARANMLIHLATHWPQCADSKFWPQATDYLEWVFNRLPSLDSGIAPNELWSGVRAHGTDMTHAHVFGCPIYVLDASLQDGKKIPKRKPRACLGLFLGFSNLHLSQVPLVSNIATGHISSQFHVIFDDKFETMHSLPADKPLNMQWAQILQLGCKCYFDIDYDKNDNSILPSLSDIIKSYSDAKAMKPTYDPTPHIEFDAGDKFVVPPHAVKSAHLTPIETPHNPTDTVPQNLALPLLPQVPLPTPPQGDWHCPTSLPLMAPGGDNQIDGYEGNACSGGATAPQNIASSHP
jgi:hypothetical protein